MGRLSPLLWIALLALPWASLASQTLTPNAKAQPSLPSSHASNSLAGAKTAEKTLALRSLRSSRSTRTQAPTQPERGEQILSAACTTCHDTRPIDTRALDEEAWTKQVKKEIDKGAAVKTDDVRPLVEYLVKYHGPLPDGPGQQLVLNICTQCHDLQRVRRERLSPEGWVEVLEAMLNEGAPLSEKDFPDVLRYLARNFRPER